MDQDIEKEIGHRIAMFGAESALAYLEGEQARLEPLRFNILKGGCLLYFDAQSALKVADLTLKNYSGNPDAQCIRWQALRLLNRLE